MASNPKYPRGQTHVFMKKEQEGEGEEKKKKKKKKKSMAEFAEERGVRLQQSRAMDAAALPSVVHGVV